MSDHRHICSLGVKRPGQAYFFGYDEGPPGLDLLFLAAMASGEWPDRDVVRGVAQGRDPAWAPLQDLLSRSGLAEADRRRPSCFRMPRAKGPGSPDLRSSSIAVVRGRPLEAPGREWRRHATACSRRMLAVWATRGPWWTG